jgi:hypothetical protein
LSLNACTGTPFEVDAPAGQLILFQVEHVNFAWGLAWRGVYVDRSGNVFSYDHSHEPWSLTAQETFTEEELLGKYSFDRELVNTLDSTIVLEKALLIADASRGSLSELEYPCADAGGSRYTAFTYDNATGVYREVLLRAEGDLFRENESGSAKALFGWLEEVTEGEFGIAGCDPAVRREKDDRVPEESFETEPSGSSSGQRRSARARLEGRGARNPPIPDS